MLKRLFLLPLVILCSTVLFGAAPGWVVTPASFQYSMSVTAVANINCVELTNPSVQLGAFVGGVLRGTALTSNVNNGRYTASLIVYSNVTSGETVTFKFYNPANDQIYDAAVTAQFQENANYGTSVSPFVVLNNNPPTAVVLSDTSINEGLPANSTVGTLSSTDADAMETFTYSLVSGAGSADNAKFSITGNTLRTTAVLNYVAAHTLYIRIRTTDANGCYFEKPFTIKVNDVNTPPDYIYISDSTVNENSTNLTTIGTLSALDYDGNESFTYLLVSGVGSTDNSSFNINGSTLRTSVPFNYEVKSVYSIRVGVKDIANNTYERQITILIKDVNDAPTAIQLNGSTSGVSFAENKPLGSVIATLTTIDEDAGNSFIYTFVNAPGNNNNDFSIVGNQLRTNNLFDYETRQNYAIFIQSSDGNGGLITNQFLLTVTDSNDAPTSMSLTNSSIIENLAPNTFIGRLNTIDPDAVSNFTYTLTNGAGSGGNGNFKIGHDSLYSTVSFDYESVNSYSIRLNVNDGSGGNYQQNFTISILNANDAPTDISLSSDQIAENLPSNSVVGSLSTNDQDAGNTFVYTLVSGAGSTDNSSFNISGANLRASVSFDYETKNTYSVRLRTTDNAGAYFDKVFTIHITNVPDAPTNIILSHDTISENRSLNTLIGVFESVSQDTALTFTYSFDNNVAGNNNSNFTIAGNQLRSNAVFDYETKNSYFIYVVSNDGAGGTFTKQFQVNIINRNDAPTDIIMNNRSVAENLPAGTFIGRITSSDPDNNTLFTYSMVSGAGDNDNASFTVSHDSLLTNAMFDYETKNVYSIRLQTDDGFGGTFQKILAVNVSNVNDNPTNITLSEVSINENLPANSNIGSFTATDQDSGNTFVYSLVSGTGSADNGSFVISGNVLRSSTVFDYETKNSYSIRVRVADNMSGTFEKQFTITINNMNDAPTDIALSNDTVTENKPLNTLIGTFATTDQDANTFTYSFSNVAGNNNSLFTISGNQLRTNTIFDYENVKTYFVYVQTNDGNGGTFTKQFQINVRDTVDAPTDLLISNNTIVENAAAGTFIGKLSSIDPDNDMNGFTYSFATGSGDQDNAAFRLTNDSLFSNVVFDYEVKHIYSIRLRTTDHTAASFQKVITVYVNNANDAPTNISINETDVKENLPAYSTVGNFTTTDQDTANTFIYTLVSGAGSSDNGSFTIVGNALRTTSVFDYETKNSYSIRVRTTDNAGGFFEKSFTINVINQNDPPTDITLSNDTITENRPMNTVIGSLTTTDQDVNTFTYSFSEVAGNNNSLFNISGSQLRSNTSFNYEQQSVYFVYVQTNDGNGGTFVKQFQINVKDSNDAPTDIALSNAGLNENLPAGSYIGQFTSTDPDPASSFTYALVSGTGSTHNSSFIIRQDSLFSAVVLNFEVQNSYSIRVRSTDNGNLSFAKSFTITVNDSNDLPTAITLSTSSISENSPIGTTIGTLNTVDPDAGQTFTYALVNGPGSTHNSFFSIQNGLLKSNAVFNYEVQNKYTVRIQTNDGNGGTFTDTFNITILDVNDAPTNITLSNNSIPENRVAGSYIGSFSTTDEDANQFSYSFASVGNNDNTSFIISGNELKANGSFNYEVKHLYVINVTTNDGNGGTFTKQFIINVTDSNDAPTDITLSANQVTENLPAHTFIGKLTTTDVDAVNGINVYTLVSGTGSTHNNSFTISNDSVYSAATFNYEAQNSYTIRIRTTDNGNLFTEKSFIITIRDSNDLPTAIALSNNVVAENMIAGTAVGTFTTTDADAGQTFTYTLVNGAGSANNNLFVIQAGVLKTNAIFNYEVKNKFTIRVQTNDGHGGTFTDTFNITVTDMNDAPTDITLSNNNIMENRAIGSPIGTFTSTDEDANTFSYSFANIGTNDNSSFILSGNELKTNAVFNFENKQLYVIHVQTNDGFGGTFTKQFLINVTDSNDAPTDILLGNNIIEENLPVHSFIGKLSITDVDAVQGINTYTFVNGTGTNNNSSFTISNDSLYTNAIFDYETQASYNIRLRATDNGGLWIEKNFVVMIKDGNDAPTAITLSNNMLKENSALRTLVGRFTTTDADAANTFTYALVAGAGSADNASFIVSGNELRSNAVFNYESRQTYNIRIRTLDNQGGSFEKDFVIEISDSNDAPTDITLSNNNFTENRQLSSIIGTFTTTDQDTHDVFIYSFINAPGNDNGSFYISGNQLRSNAMFDYETKRTYNIYMQVTDGLAIFGKQFIINITDSNDAPTAVSLYNQEIEENLPSGTFISALYSTDADATGSHNYTLVNGTGSANNGSFRISNDSLYTNAMFNYESKALYSIRVRSTDNGNLWVEKQFDIKVINANDAPTDITLSATEITENRLSRTLVATLSTSDADITDQFSYSLVPGTGSADNASFVISGNQLLSNRSFNFEAQSVYNIRIMTNDGHNGTFEKAFTITIIDSNDAPSGIVLSATNVVENATIGTRVCTMSTIDQDAGDVFNYSFVNVAGNNNSSFIIVGNELRTNQVFDYETKNFYLVLIQTTDAAGSSFVKQFVIDIRDTNDAPIAMELSNNVVDENQPAGAFVGTLSAADPDQADNFSYTLTSGAGATDNSSFRISGDSLLTNAAFNFEVKKSYLVRIRVSDQSNGTFDRAFVININDVNDAPVSFTINKLDLRENLPLGSLIGTFSTTDADADDQHQYTLVSGTGDADNAHFIITDGKLLSNVVADYETKSSYSIRVRSEDLAGEGIENTYVVNVVDVSEKPVILNQKFSVSENAELTHRVGTLTSASPDAGAVIKYSFMPSADNPFTVDENTGEITVSAKLDYEKQQVYKLKVMIKDDQDIPLFDTAEVTININDEIETKQGLPANNYMSPNGDGQNDVFAIENVELYADYSLTIYNESGMQVYKTAGNYQNDWDGTYNGNSLPKGVYFYVFHNSRTGDEFKGSINIIK